jgi:hypothetical protein
MPPPLHTNITYIFIHSLKPLNKAEVCVQLVFVVFVRTDLFVEQNRRTKTQYVGPFRAKLFVVIETEPCQKVTLL